MAHICETKSFLMIVTMDNRLVVMRENLELKDIIKIDDSGVNSMDLVEDGRILLISTKAGTIKSYQTSAITEGVAARSVDFQAGHLG